VQVAIDGTDTNTERADSEGVISINVKRAVASSMPGSSRNTVVSSGSSVVLVQQFGCGFRVHEVGPDLFGGQ
jgi:hypothetical protein